MEASNTRVSGKNAYTRHTFSTISVQHTFINQGVSCEASHIIFTSTTTTTTTILRPFFRDHPGEPVPEENFWTLWCKERLTEADTLILYHLAGRHSIRTNQCPPPPSPRLVVSFGKLLRQDFVAQLLILMSSYRLEIKKLFCEMCKLGHAQGIKDELANLSRLWPADQPNCKRSCWQCLGHHVPIQTPNNFYVMNYGHYFR